MNGGFYIFHLKNAGRPNRIDHSTCKSTGGVLCVVERYQFYIAAISDFEMAGM